MAGWNVFALIATVPVTLGLVLNPVYALLFLVGCHIFVTLMAQPLAIFDLFKGD